MVKISIIVPVYNVGKYIRRCIDSLRTQTFNEIEILLIDDGSKDDSGAICDEYALKDNRIKVIHKENGGVSSARNAGLDNSTGIYIMFCDPDDYVEPTWCEKMYNTMNENGTFFGICGFNRVNAEDGRIIDTSLPLYSNEIAQFDEAILYLYHTGLFRPVWNGIFSTEIIRDNLLRFDETLARNEDTAFVIDYLQLADKRISFVSLPLYNYSVGIKDSLTHATPINYWESELLWLKKIQQLMEKHNINYCAYREKYCSHIIYAAVTAVQAAMNMSMDSRTMFKRGREIMCSKEYKEAFKYGSFQDIHPLYKIILKTRCFFLVWLFHWAVKLKHWLVGKNTYAKR